MSARTIPASAGEAAHNELLSQLGLTPAASPEDVDQIHQAVSEYLASAPAGIRGWAHAQSAALDAAYLSLTDPVGFSGSALRSPTRPPRVVPGGPATPPARRVSLPVPPTAPAELDEPDEAAGVGEDDLAALYASVTPSAHEDMGPDHRRPRPRRLAAAPAVAEPRASDNGWKKVALGGLGMALVLGIAFAGYLLGGGGTGSASGGPNAAQASPSAPVIDEAKVAGLMQQLQAKPNDTAVLLALADEYYAGGLFDTSATWLDKLLAIDPEHIQALLARGAVYFNLADNDAALATWNKVLELDPENQEAHYDLGFMYFYQVNPDYSAVQREWGKVIELDPTTEIAKNAKAHLDALAEKSMLPAASPGASPAASPAPSAAGPAASPAASTVP